VYFALAWQEKEIIRVQSFFFGLGLFFLFSAPLIMRTNLINAGLDWIIVWFESTFQFPYDIFTLGMIILGYGLMAGFENINFFAELNWPNKLMGVFVYLNESGIPIFTYRFRGSGYTEKSLDEALIAAGFAGIVTIIEEVTQSSEKLKVIEQKDSHILIETGKHVTAFLVVKDNLIVLKNKLKDFLNDFELLFEDQLQHWKGKVDYFDPARFLVQKHFTVQERPS
ncbi:MAG: hypothetical protein ACXQS8_00995, partial [Candidatus Helarchaeales archaeon]